ncbi:MerR family transcriptional regulator [Micromonospora sp. WMMD1128]|uniref:MerR family transcriptional regulator n=1 Tax=unclassified Micromonospora TaxID=2617518 RepID=UPI00248B0638|nr:MULTISPECIES: MerR family transcriptional regulator [unclassified Micromonospora]WBB76701.1 MerR family transcriptional regulator [Micromonospora sp. WMMD1128]WFE35512.1 MerR family transcriptional regulator [Micromonospora sp. WMMD975]
MTIDEVTTTPGGSAGYTVEELARKVGMSPRNIRAHQARRLLPPPVRHGRAAFYDDSHVRRLDAILALQRQGFNLVSIEAMLGVRARDEASDGLTAMLQRLTTDRPALAHALTRHGVIGRTSDGTVRTVRPRPLRAALDLQRVRVGTAPALQTLSEVLDSLRPVADELVAAVTARLLALAPDLVRGGARSSWADLDRETLLLTQGVVNVLSEAFRLAVENQAEAHVAELLENHLDTDVCLEDSSVIDNG